jgi:chromosomal replication initiator protein
LKQIKDTIWSQTLSALSLKIDESSFKTWFEPTTVEWEQDHTLIINVPSRFFLEWIYSNYMALIQQYVNEISGQPITIRIKVDENCRLLWEQAAPPEPPVIPSKPANAALKESYLPSKEIRLGIPLSPRYIFENFIIGNSNRFACAASMAVAEAPSRSYNPLFIYGKVGLGKTHLLHAIGNYIRQNRPELKVLNVSSEIFLNEMIRCLRSNKMEEFRSAFRDIDVLLVDDIQFLENKESTQQEFYHTFNSLFEHSKQIVATSDSHPKDINVFDKLKSRFEWGLTVDIQPPDLETRIAILRKKCERENLYSPNDVILLIAESMRSNIRDMEGSLNRVAAYASLTRQELTLDLARQVLKDVLQSDITVVSIDKIQNIIASHYNIKTSEMRGKARTSNLVMARQMAMYMARELTNASLTEIGEAFGGKNHSTVIHAIEKIKDTMEKNGTFITQVDYLAQKIKSGN